MEQIGITARKAIRRLSVIIRRRSLGRFNFDKLATLKTAFASLRPAPVTFADLGGVWGVHGAYTFEALDHHPIKAAYLVDTDFTKKVLRKKQRYPNLNLINENFGTRAVPEQLGPVDLILLFDVLLHQVKPDWDELLAMYAPVTRAFVIFNPQFRGSDRTVRLLDLGKEAYFRNVPYRRNNPSYQGLFARLDERHPQHDRPWRDIHNIWQWGITDQDLRDQLAQLGFAEIHYRNYGRFGSLENFENHAFIFVKR